MFSVTSCPSICLFILKILSAMVCLSPLDAKPSFPLWWGRCPAAQRYQAADLCHFRAHSASVMSAVLLKNIYTWTSPSCLAAMQVMPYWFSYWVSVLWRWRGGITAWPVYQSLVCVISCHAFVRLLSQQIMFHLMSRAALNLSLDIKQCALQEQSYR